MKPMSELSLCLVGRPWGTKKTENKRETKPTDDEDANTHDQLGPGRNGGGSFMRRQADGNVSCHDAGPQQERRRQVRN